MKISSRNGSIFYNGYQLSANAYSYNVSAKVAPIDATGFTEGAQNFVPGQNMSEMSAEFYWNLAAGATHDALGALTTPPGIVTIVPEYITPYSGRPVSLSLRCMQANYNPVGDLNDVIKIGAVQFASYGDNPGVEYGIVLGYDTFVGAPYALPSYDYGAGMTGDYSATLHITGAVAGGRTYLVQDSPDDLVWTTRITFTLDGSAIAAERIAQTGALARYVRLYQSVGGVAAQTVLCHLWRSA
jgi:hypothetical protein